VTQCTGRCCCAWAEGDCVVAGTVDEVHWQDVLGRLFGQRVQG
jgi:hypothetical protein